MPGREYTSGINNAPLKLYPYNTRLSTAGVRLTAYIQVSRASTTTSIIGVLDIIQELHIHTHTLWIP